MARYAAADAQTETTPETEAQMSTDTLSIATEQNLRNALEHIRVAALIHYFGQAFDPEHMRGLANLATMALRGDDIPPLPDPAAYREEAQALWEWLNSDTGDDGGD